MLWPLNDVVSNDVLCICSTLMHNLKKKETQRDGSLEYSKAWSLIDSPQKVPGLGCSRKLWPVVCCTSPFLKRKGFSSAIPFRRAFPEKDCFRAVFLESRRERNIVYTAPAPVPSLCLGHFHLHLQPQEFLLLPPPPFVSPATAFLSNRVRYRFSNKVGSRRCQVFRSEIGHK